VGSISQELGCGEACKNDLLKDSPLHGNFGKILMGFYNVDSHVSISLSPELLAKSKKHKSDLEASRCPGWPRKSAGQPLRRKSYSYTEPGRTLFLHLPLLWPVRHQTHQLPFTIMSSTLTPVTYNN
jgi:hypothetical protein